ncbi:hypothetical protein ABID42_000946 [Arcicella rosea]|uniref:hypothetical protein n=1 Tax=Arcicella rosea TaxID=502909 RepID=UPI00345D760E
MRNYFGSQERYKNNNKVMNNFGFEFDKIIIIESLPEHEKQIRDGILMSSGEYYTQTLFPYCSKMRNESFSYELVSVSSRDELLYKLDEICDEIKKSNEYPLIHFEIHGTEEQNGITVKNGDFVDWTTLLAKLTNINELTVNNLFVIFATCSGAFNLKYIMPRETVFPYYAALAPDDPDFPVFLEERYSLFYLDLLIGGDIKNAIEKINKADGHSNIIFSTCEFYLQQAFKQEMAKLKNEERIESLFQFLKKEKGGEYSDEKLKELLINKISEQTFGLKILKKLKTKHLMADHPNNLGRFNFLSDMSG